jgi:hypothetical protein
MVAGPAVAAGDEVLRLPEIPVAEGTPSGGVIDADGDALAHPSSPFLPVDGPFPAYHSLNGTVVKTSATTKNTHARA